MSQCENLYNGLLDKCGACREILGKAADHVSLGHALEVFWADTKLTVREQERRLVNWHFANLEFANASRLNQISLRGWDQDDPYEFRGKHVFLAGGNGQLLNALAADLDILCNQTVAKVKYAKSGIEVMTEKDIHRGCLLIFSLLQTDTFLS